MAIYKITLSQSNWSGGTAAIWYDTATAKFYAEQTLAHEVTGVAVPTRELYRFNGFYSSSSNGTQYIDAQGNFTAALRDLSINAAKTFYAQGTQVSHKLTLSDNSGSGGDGALYYRISGGGYYADYLCDGSPAASVTKPTRANYAFAGYHNGTSTPGTQYIDADGGFTSALSSLTLTGAKTIYARWVAPYKITISANSGTGGTAAFYFDSVGGKFYAGQDMAEEITAVVPHTLECFAFLGCRASNNDTSDLRISTDGGIAGGWVPTANATIYARWERVSWKITLNKQSGTGGTDAIYGGVSGGFWSDDLCTERITSVTVPTREGYTFWGYFRTTGGDDKYINADGTINLSQSVVSTGVQTWYAHWTASTYTLTFDPNGGTCSTASKTVTFGSGVGSLPTPTKNKADFAEWRVNGLAITSSTTWNIAADATAVAEWNYFFGRVTDWFNLASASLIPFKSDDGTNRPRVVTRHYGKAAGAEQTGPVWRNPYVKYMVVGDMTLSVTLGKAYAKKTGTINGPYVSNGTWYFGNHSGMTETGYMITEVTIDTRHAFPVVTVSAVANEGRDAINTFAVSVAISARARAQNLLGGVSGGGQLQTVSLRAVCAPVVLAEGAEPCASDVVNGRYELRADTLAANLESAPVAAGGFVATGEPAACGGTEYKRYTLMATKEIT